jgi:hypothetical protein
MRAEGFVLGLGKRDQLLPWTGAASHRLPYAGSTRESCQLRLSGDIHAGRRPRALRPKLNPKRDESYSLNQPGAAKGEVDNKPPSETVGYEQLIAAWREGRVR